jgi:PAS domain-containing protein
MSQPEPRANRDAVAEPVSGGSHLVACLMSSLLPCAVVDASGFLIAVSPGLTAFVSDALGRRISEALGVADCAVALEPHIAYGAYHNAAGEFTPVAVYFVPLPSSEPRSLALVFDGRPFRDAEAARLEAAPYSVIRSRLDGQIVFANASALKAFGTPAVADLVGLPLAALFAPEYATAIAEALSVCVRGTAIPPMMLVGAARPNRAPEPLVLSLMPDPAPGGLMLGSVAVTLSRAVAQTRAAIKRIALEKGDWRLRLRKVLEQVRSLVPFDRATFGVYSENAALFRAVHIEPADARPWPTRWMVLQKYVRPWLEGGSTWNDDLVTYVEAHPELKDDAVVAQHLEDGIRAFVTLPVAGPDGPTSSLSLASVNVGTYDADSLAKLEDVDLAQALMMFEREISAERVALCRRLETGIRRAGSLSTAATLLVRELRDTFDWDHVSVFAIQTSANGDGREFRLLQQAYKGDYSLPPDFRQNSSNGMLGATLRANPNPHAEARTSLVIENIRPQPERYDYKPVNAQLLSAMTCPVRFNGDWRWILNVEASVANAFHGPDKEAVDEIITQLEAELERLYHSELTRLLLEKIPEGVIVVGYDGAILAANPTATDRFLDPNFDTRPKFDRLVDYGADATTRDVLGGRLADTSRRLELKGADGRIRPVLATRYELAAEFQSSVWFLTDLENLDWNVEYRYLREVVNDIAQQTRGPLILAANHLSNLVGELSNSADRGKVESAIVRTLTEIGKADITFERLAEGLVAVKEPKRRNDPVDLGGCLEDLVAGLPQRDAQHITMKMPENRVTILADKGRLLFAFRSILGYLLSCRADCGDAAGIEVKLDRDRAGVCLRMCVSGLGLTADAPLQESTDPLWTAVQLARDDARLGLQAVERIIGAHGGSIHRERMPSDQVGWIPPELNFRIVFASSEAEETAI